MRTIDIHAHVVPQALWRAADAGKEWHGFRHEPGDGVGVLVGGGKRIHFTSPKVRFTPEERLRDMDAQGVDVQVVSIHTPLFGYHLEPAEARALARDVNDEIAAMTRQWPARFAGLATLPVPDVKAAIAELERAVTVLGLKGAELDTVVNGENWDEPEFLPLSQGGGGMGAVLSSIPQPQHNFMLERTTRYGLFNSLGVIVEDAIVVAILILGGVLEACPSLRACIAHGGGPACFAMGRHRPRVAWPRRGPAAHPPPAEQLPAPPLLRLRDRQRGRPPVPPRPGGGGPRGARQRLALRALGPVSRHMGTGAGEPDRGRERADPLEEPGVAARTVGGAAAGQAGERPRRARPRGRMTR